mmetsp:Transcript_82787/g.208431  ORF Transcript_82787/g.208431 Transcript_82787/m.208431 type:complete len:230 (-) Transcript_82787:1171-1860(-)
MLEAYPKQWRKIAKRLALEPDNLQQHMSSTHAPRQSKRALPISSRPMGRVCGALALYMCRPPGCARCGSGKERIFRARRPNYSEDHGFLGEEVHPMLIFVLRDGTNATGVTAESTWSQIVITELHFQPVPARSCREVPEGDGSPCRLSTGVFVKLLQGAVPPTERAPELHFPLELDPHPDTQPLCALEHTVWVGRRAFFVRLAAARAAVQTHVRGTTGLRESRLQLRPR